MKKTLAAFLLLAAVVGIVCAGTPFRETVSIVAGTGTYTYATDGIVKPYAEAIKILAILTPSGTTTTNVIKFIDGTVTNTIATKIVAANDSDQLITTDWWHFAGEKIRIESSNTNTWTAVIIGEEE